jgi:hypothetical protein
MAWHLHVVTAGAPDPELTSSALTKRSEEYHLKMKRLHSECSDSESPDRSLRTDILLREDPEDEEEHDGGEDENGDDGYSE